MQFTKVKKEDLNSVKKLSKIAAGIVKKHFDPIIGAEQNDYMTDKFLSVESITKQLEKGYQYYFVKDNQVSIRLIIRMFFSLRYFLF